MKKILFFICLMLFVVFNVSAEGVTSLSAQSAVLIEQSTGRVLFDKNCEKRMKPASTTKILTAICALEYGNLDDIVTVSKNAACQEGSSMYLNEGEKIKLEDLIYGLMLNSGNDAAVAIAEYISKDTIKFSKLMNEKAVDIGAYNSNFVTPNGLDDENHYVTAKDLALITASALENEKFCEIVKTRNKVITTENGNKKYLTNHNKMLSLYNGCIGVKTGFTKASGRTLVTASDNNGIKLIAVTLNASDDWNDHKKLLDFGNSRVRKINILDKEKEVFDAVVKNGVKSGVKLKCENGYSDIEIDGNKDKFELKYNVKKLKAPVMKNEIAGSVEVYKNGEKVFKTNLRSLESVDKIKKEKTFWNVFKRFLEIW